VYTASVCYFYSTADHRMHGGVDEIKPATERKIVATIKRADDGSIAMPETSPSMRANTPAVAFVAGVRYTVQTH